MKNPDKLPLPTALRRTLRIIIALAAAGAAAFLGWYLVNYRGYDAWQAYVTAPVPPEEGTELKTARDPENRVPGFSLVAENDRLGLYLQEKTAGIALLDRENGWIIYSNPQDAADDPVARSGLNQANLKSQFILNYLDTNSREGTPWSSYAKAVENGQVEYSRIENGFRAVYTLSNEKLMLVPRQLTAEWYEILSQAGKKQAAKSYVPDEESGLYVLKSQGVTARNRQQIDADARAAGFTIEDYEEMQALAETADEETAESLSFVITLDYTQHLTNFVRKRPCFALRMLATVVAVVSVGTPRTRRYTVTKEDVRQDEPLHALLLVVSLSPPQLQLHRSPCRSLRRSLFRKRLLQALKRIRIPIPRRRKQALTGNNHHHGKRETTKDVISVVA